MDITINDTLRTLNGESPLILLTTAILGRKLPQHGNDFVWKVIFSIYRDTLRSYFGVNKKDPFRT